MLEVINLKKAEKIQPCERDLNLCLADPSWPSTELLKDRWQHNSGYLARVIRVGGNELTENMVRLPSAPIYGLNRKPQFQYTIGKRINYHTLRLLKRPDTAKVERVYLLYNGLDELTHFTLYYELANHLLTETPGAACIIKPTPGHLTRYPFDPVFSESPLQRYLHDSGDLFRQFLKHMVETQWLLSILFPSRVPARASIPKTGLRLLYEGAQDHVGLVDHQRVAELMYEEWMCLASASNSAAKLKKPNNGNDDGIGQEDCISQDAIRNIVKTIRSLVGYESVDSHEEHSGKGGSSSPAIHTIGYSLGGFFAQSVFFTWPTTVSSCTTLCSGGLLSDIALTKFAHPEEWQTVLQLLRYELDSSLIEDRIIFDKKKKLIAGMKQQDFVYLHEIFYEVFLRQLAGDYKSRVGEYVQRLLFIMGGGILLSGLNQ